MDYRRNFQPGGTFFFTVVTYRRQNLFSDPSAIALLQTVVGETTDRPFTMNAWVILHDHLHMIWTLPKGDADFSHRWARVKSQFTRRWLTTSSNEVPLTPGKKRDGRRGVWQPKFFEHTIRDEDDMIAHIEYIHYNPVKHGYVDCPKDWPHSSFHEFARRDIYPQNWCCGPSDPPVSDLPYGRAE